MTFSLCSTVGENTGGIDCDKKKGTPVKFMVGAAGFDADDWASSADMLSAILAFISQPAGSADKLFPFPTIQGNTDNTEANTEGNLGYGLKFITREGRPSYTFQILTGETQYKALRKFNNTISRVIFIDDSNTLWGTKDSTGAFVGYQCLIFVSGNSFEDGNAAEKKAATVTLSFVSAAEFHDASWYMPVDFTEADLQGLKTGNLAKVGAVSATTKVEIKIPTAQLGFDYNVHDKYHDELAVAGLWEAFSGATEAEALAGTTALALTGVTDNADPDKTWSIAFDATPYGALGSNAWIMLRLKNPATLLAAGVSGLEGYRTTFQKP
jgi:hypothetical protein